MNKTFFLAWLIVFVVWMTGSFIVHGVLLQADYAALPALFRAEADAQQYFALMLLAHIIMSGALAWIYARGAQARPWLAQGLRFGVVIALLSVIPTYMIYYVVQPMPGWVVVKQIVFDTALLLLLGAFLGFVYRRQG